MYKETRHLTSRQIAEAAEIVRKGGLVVFPTETVYGLGANALSDEACRAIFAAKGRPPDNPLIVHVAELSAVKSVAQEIPPEARRLFDAFAPGPLTVILPRHPEISTVATTGLDSVAVRIPAHPTAQAFLSACAVPVAAPSANFSGKPSPTDAETAASYMEGRVDAVLDGGPCRSGVESTILRVSSSGPSSQSVPGSAESCVIEVLREGAVTHEMIRALLGDGVKIRSVAGAAAVRAPGTAYRHYEPAARCVAVEPPVFVETVTEELRQRAAGAGGRIGIIGFAGTLERLQRELQARQEMPVNSLPYFISVGDAAEYARELYRAFWRFDRAGCELIVAEWPPTDGIGRALRDRLWRASGGTLLRGGS